MQAHTGLSSEYGGQVKTITPWLITSSTLAHQQDNRTCHRTHANCRPQRCHCAEESFPFLPFLAYLLSSLLSLLFLCSTHYHCLRTTLTTSHFICLQQICSFGVAVFCISRGNLATTDGTVMSTAVINNLTGFSTHLLPIVNYRSSFFIPFLFLSIISFCWYSFVFIHSMSTHKHTSLCFLYPFLIRAGKFRLWLDKVLIGKY